MTPVRSLCIDGVSSPNLFELLFHNWLFTKESDSGWGVGSVGKVIAL